LQKIIVCFLTPFSGSFVLELHGGIYLQIAETEKIFIDIFVAGGTKALVNKILERLIGGPDYEWLMIDASSDPSDKKQEV